MREGTQHRLRLGSMHHADCHQQNITQLSSFEGYTSHQQQSLRRLRTLDLSFNKLTTLTDSQMQRFDALTVLNLSHNRLRTILCLPPNAQDINLSYNRLVCIPTCLHELHRLQCLDLSHNYIEAHNPESQGCGKKSSTPNQGLSARRVEATQASPVRDSGLKADVHSRTNHASSIPRTCAVDLNPTKSRTLPLRRLSLSHNRLVSLMDVMLENFPNIEVLDLSFNLFDTVDQLVPLLTFPKLEALTIHGNPITQRVTNYEQFLIELLPQLQHVNGLWTRDPSAGTDLIGSEEYVAQEEPSTTPNEGKDTSEEAMTLWSFLGFSSRSGVHQNGHQSCTHSDPPKCMQARKHSDPVERSIRNLTTTSSSRVEDLTSLAGEASTFTLGPQTELRSLVPEKDRKVREELKRLKDLIRDQNSTIRELRNQATSEAQANQVLTAQLVKAKNDYVNAHRKIRQLEEDYKEDTMRFMAVVHEKESRIAHLEDLLSGPSVQSQRNEKWVVNTG